MMTPLKCIITYAEYLLTVIKVKEDWLKVICILRTSQILKHYTKDLLDRALIENKTLVLTKESAKISRVVKEVVGIIKFQAEQSIISVEFYNQNSEDEPYVSVDRQRMQQVVFNLLSNAIKFSHSKSTVNVSLKINATGTQVNNEEELKVEVKVVDQGIGLTPVQLTRLFKPFSVGQDKASSDKNPSGNGLGLSICKSIMTGMAGDIEVKSYEGYGTTFTAWFLTTVLDPAQDQHFAGEDELSMI